MAVLDTLARSHKRIGAVQGGLSLALARHAFTPRFMRVYIKTLRSVADDLEKELKP